jgi:hypothetical protein
MFVLRIPVTLLAVELIKSGPTKSLPEVKSSHRVEALGRGLGFRTYAALLAASESPVPPIAVVSGAVFLGYLKGHGLEADPAHLYRAAAHVAIRGVLDRCPSELSNDRHERRRVWADEPIGLPCPLAPTPVSPRKLARRPRRILPLGS